MVYGTSLEMWPIAGSGASRGGRIMGAETSVSNELRKLSFWKVMGGWFCEKV